MLKIKSVTLFYNKQYKIICQWKAWLPPVYNSIWVHWILEAVACILNTPTKLYVKFKFNFLNWLFFAQDKKNINYLKTSKHFSMTSLKKNN